jgi:pseudouridine-5'-phosphate glycosidase/pseudouridine kinase
MDLSCDYTPRESNKDASPRMHTSNIGEIRSSVGGVGYNVALAAQLSSGEPVRLCSIVVKDQ